MNVDPREFWPPLAQGSSLSSWMVRREQRNQLIHVTWLGGLAVSLMIGLLAGPLLWVPVAVAFTRGAELATMWIRVCAMRRRRTLTGRMLVLAAVPRGRVHVRPDKPASWEECLVAGCLEISPDGWTWRPGVLTSSEFARLHVPQAAVSGVAFTPAAPRSRDARKWLCAGQDAGGETAGFLVWDWDVLPPVWPRAGS